MRKLHIFCTYFEDCAQTAHILHVTSCAHVPKRRTFCTYAECGSQVCKMSAAQKQIAYIMYAAHVPDFCKGTLVWVLMCVCWCTVCGCGCVVVYVGVYIFCECYNVLVCYSVCQYVLVWVYTQWCIYSYVCTAVQDPPAADDPSTPTHQSSTSPGQFTITVLTGALTREGGKGMTLFFLFCTTPPPSPLFFIKKIEVYAKSVK